MSNIRGMCKVCACTEAEACEEGCGWTDASQTLCTACAPLSDAERAAKRSANLAELGERLMMIEGQQQELALRCQVLRRRPAPRRSQAQRPKLGRKS